jgi:hypothetical protein
VLCSRVPLYQAMYSTIGDTVAATARAAHWRQKRATQIALFNSKREGYRGTWRKIDIICNGRTGVISERQLLAATRDRSLRTWYPTWSRHPPGPARCGRHGRHGKRRGPAPEIRNCGLRQSPTALSRRADTSWRGTEGSYRVLEERLPIADASQLCANLKMPAGRALAIATFRRTSELAM